MGYNFSIEKSGFVLPVKQEARIERAKNNTERKDNCCYGYEGGEGGERRRTLGVVGSVCVR